MHNNTKKINNQDSSTKFPSTTIESIKDTESKKLDSNGDEIVWKYKEKKVGFFITLIHLIPVTIFFLYLLIEGIHIVGAFICICPLYRLIKLLNQKALYITNKNIVVERHIGKTIIAPLEVSYIQDYSSMWGAIIYGMSSVLTFYRIDSRDYKKISFILSFGCANIDELYSYLLPKIEAYLIGLQEKEYIECKIILNIDGKMDSRIDFKKIERLRKEKEKNG